MQTSFLLPQWGGIYIFNQLAYGEDMSRLTALQLRTIFLAFADQLSALLGVPSVPAGVKSAVPSGLSDWQLDTLLRYRTVENIVRTQQTLHSIVKLVDRIENMPVDEIVRGDVDNALTALDQVRSSIEYGYMNFTRQTHFITGTPIHAGPPSEWIAMVKQGTVPGLPRLL